jgi:hypothetical protein
MGTATIYILIDDKTNGEKEVKSMNGCNILGVSRDKIFWEPCLHKRYDPFEVLRDATRRKQYEVYGR